MLKKIVSIFKILILSIFTYVFLSNSGLLDYFMAKLIPIYPSANNLSINHGSGFPDGSPGANINFYSSDNGDRIMHYYKDKMQNNWRLTQDSKEIMEDGHSQSVVELRKKIGFLEYIIRVIKSDTPNKDRYQEYGYARVIIFVKHKVGFGQ